MYHLAITFKRESYCALLTWSLSKFILNSKKVGARWGGGRKPPFHRGGVEGLMDTLKFVNQEEASRPDVWLNFVLLEGRFFNKSPNFQFRSIKTQNFYIVLKNTTIFCVKNPWFSNTLQ